MLAAILTRVMSGDWVQSAADGHTGQTAEPHQPPAAGPLAVVGAASVSATATDTIAAVAAAGATVMGATGVGSAVGVTGNQ